MSHEIASHSKKARAFVLVATFLALLFDSVELGLMPIASLSVSKSLLGEAYTKEIGGQWFAWYAAALMLGAALGGIFLGNLGDRIGRSKAMGFCILFYSLFAGLGAVAQSQEQMLILRFVVGLGVGGLWPNGMAIASEFWPGASRPLVSGSMMAGMNAGILALSQTVRYWPITADSWRWVFLFAAVPAVLGVLVLVALPESPRWLDANKKSKAEEETRKPTSILELFQGSLLRRTLIGIMVSAIPMVGAWSASKWMIPWADSVAADSNYKAVTQGWWALGAVLGSLGGAQLASLLGRRLSYCLISLATFIATWAMFQWTRPLEPSFHTIVFIQGLLGTLFFGWLALSLPELFPTRVRATGSGLCYNAGRFATAAGVLFAGVLISMLGGDYARVGAICALIYVLGFFVIWLVPKSAVSELN